MSLEDKLTGKKRLLSIVIIVLSCISGWGLNSFNLSKATQLEANGPVQTLKGITISSPDNIYYLSPVENYLQGLGWRQSPPVGNGSYLRRTPGYSIVYFCFRIFLDLETTLRALKVFQFFLFICSVYCVYRCFQLLKVSYLTSTVLTLIYGCSPFFSSYTFFTLTESISPFLIVFFMYFLLKADCESNNSRKYLFAHLSSFFIGYAAMTRPYLGLFIIVTLIFALRSYWAQPGVKKIFTSFSWIIIPFLMIGTWAVRNYALTNEIVLLEKANHPQSLDRMKPEFSAFWNFTKCWAEDGSKMNSYHIPFYSATLKGDTSDVYVNHIMENIPEDVKQEIGELRIRNTIENYRSVIYSQRKYFEKNIAMPSEYSPDELRVAADFNSITSEWVRHHWFRHHMLTPLKYLRDIILHSNTSNLLIFQSPFREKIFFINIYRFLLASTHIAIYSLLIIGLLMNRHYPSLQYIFFVVVPVTFLLFFVLYFQAIEQRYMLPVLPVILVGTGVTIDRLKSKLNSVLINGEK